MEEDRLERAAREPGAEKAKRSARGEQTQRLVEYRDTLDQPIDQIRTTIFRIEQGRPSPQAP